MAHLQCRSPRTRSARTRPDRVRGDKAYSSGRSAAICGDRGITAVIPEPSIRSGTATPRFPRRPPTAFDSGDYRGRNVVERRFNPLKQWRGLATRYDKLAIVYRSAVVLHAVVTWTKTLSDTP